MHLHYLLAPALLLALLVSACDTAQGPSLYDPVERGTLRQKPDPTVTSISPAPGQALAGVTTLTITGQNFVVGRDSAFQMVDGVRRPALKDSTYVYFNGKRVPVLTVTPTAITLRAPNMVSSTLQVKVSTIGAENFSPTRVYGLLAAVERVGDTKKNEQPIGMTTDAAGATYVSVLVGGAPGGIRKTNAAGQDSLYAPSASTYAGLAFSPQTGGLMAVRNGRRLYQIVRGVGEQTFLDLPGNVRLRAIDADEAGNLWVGGSNGVAFYRVAPDKSLLTVPYAGANVLAIEARAGFVYVSAIVAGAHKVVRFALSGGTVGAAEDVFDVTANLPGVQVNALAFAANGDLFLGTNRAKDPVLQIRVGTTRAESLYPDLLVIDTAPGAPGVVALSWGPGNLLHAAGAEITAVKTSLDAIGDVIRINTLRQGEP